jgi:hypothetical protein
MQALRGIRNLRSTATRLQQRQVTTQPARFLKENADTTKLSSSEAAKLGAAKQPPNSDKGPGSFMHQQSNLATKNNKFLQPWLFPIYPMIGMVALGVSLGIMTAYRQLVVNPGVLLDKSKRTDELPEVHDKEWVMKMSRRYAEDSPLRNLSTEHKISPFGRHLDEDVEVPEAVMPSLKGAAPQLPGDERPAVGPGPEEQKPRPLGSNN